MEVLLELLKLLLLLLELLMLMLLLLLLFDGRGGRPWHGAPELLLADHRSNVNSSSDDDPSSSAASANSSSNSNSARAAPATDQCHVRVVSGPGLVALRGQVDGFGGGDLAQRDEALGAGAVVVEVLKIFFFGSRESCESSRRRFSFFFSISPSR